MSRLSKQSIRALCEGPAPMIHPFEPDKVRVEGVSKGLSHASYDASIAHDLVLGRHPGVVIAEWQKKQDFSMPQYWLKDLSWWRPFYSASRLLILIKDYYKAQEELQELLEAEPKWFSLAHTIEDFNMPPDVGGDVADKSTFARVFVSAYNTFFDPGFHGNATLELVNDSDKRVSYKAGQGVCQFIFTWLDEATEDPYSGKYQGQTKAAHAARFEEEPEVLNFRKPPDGWHISNSDSCGVVSGMPDLLPQPRTEDDVKQLEEDLRAADIRVKAAVADYWPGAAPEQVASFLRDQLSEAKAKVDAALPRSVTKSTPVPQVEVERVKARFAAQNHHQLERERDVYGLGQG